MKKHMIALLVGGLIIGGSLPAYAVPAPARRAQISIHVRVNEKSMQPVHKATVEFVIKGHPVIKTQVDASGNATVSAPADINVDSAGIDQYQLYDLVIKATGFQDMTMTNIPAMFDNPVYVDVPMTRGSGKTEYRNPVPKMRPGIKYGKKSSAASPKHPANGAGVASTSALAATACYTNWYESPTTLTQPDINVANYVTDDTEQLILKSLTREFAGSTPSNSWNPEALKVGAIAIRSWLLYFTSYTSKHTYNGTPYVKNSTADLTWFSYYSQEALDAANAVPFTYASYGSIVDGTCKPASTYFSGIVTSQEAAYGAGYSKNQVSDGENKPYLQSVYDEADFTNNMGSTYIKVQYLPAPGLSQQGANSWAQGFYDHTGASQLPRTYDWILGHYYSNRLSLLTADH